ncbi:MAG: class I SAM-dependent methyltransferase [Vicinamibacterales bacterium]
MMKPKSTVDEIRARFDNDVERFSNLETGQSATIDAPLMLDLVAEAAAAMTPRAAALLDIGCGAGNYSLKVLERVPNLEVTVVDLSQPMLDRAVERIGRQTSRPVTAVRGDIRDLDIGRDSFDIIVAAAVLHHLRTDDEWRAVFSKCYATLRRGGSMWIADLVSHDAGEVQSMMWARYGAYLEAVRGAEYRDHVLAYVEHEDTPRSLAYQTDVLRAVGFGRVEILHKHGCFAAFGAIK